MKQVYVECKPDQELVTKLGISRTFLTHHQGKSRIFSKLSKSEGLLALVDEDPGSARTRYEASLKLIKEFEGIKFYTDPAGNIVLELKGKLEDWIIMICKKHNISVLKYGLPEKPNDLHDVINYKLNHCCPVKHQYNFSFNIALLCSFDTYVQLPHYKYFAALQLILAAAPPKYL